MSRVILAERVITMKFYEKYFKNCYEELLTYYPEFYKKVYEMNEILKVFGNISDEFESCIEQVYLNNFILTADADTLKIWEDILGITYSEKLPIEQRRRVIVGRISGGKHIGEQEIRTLISNYTDKKVSVDFEKGSIKINISGEIFDESNLLKTLLQRIPAHIPLDMTVQKKRSFRQNIAMFGGIYCYTHITSKRIKEV